MANAYELKENRQKILQKLINDLDLCKLVLFDDTLTSIDDADLQEQLMNQNIFKFPYVPDTQDIMRQFVCFDMDLVSSIQKSTYKNLTLYFWVFCHKELVKHRSGYNRSDLIDERIQTLFNGKSFFGIGKLVCTGDRFLQVGQSYFGRRLIFETLELNKSQRIS